MAKSIADEQIVAIQDQLRNSQQIARITREESIASFVKVFKPIRKNARFMKRFRRLRIVVNGPVGSGKSTLVDILKQVAMDNDVPVEAFYERVPLEKLMEFIAFEKQYGKKVKNPFAFPLQMEILELRLEDAARATQEAKDKLVIMDRSLAGDYVFARANYERGNFDEAEWLLYMERFLQTDIIDCDIYIHMDVNFEITLPRIEMRRRPGEDKYDPEYLLLNYEIGEEVSKALKCPVLRLAWNSNWDVLNKDERYRIGMKVFKSIDEVLNRDADDQYGHVHIVC